MKGFSNPKGAIGGLVAMVIAAAVVIGISNPLYDAVSKAGRVKGTESIYTPGTYTASADGFGGEVIATVTVTDKDIDDIELVADSETPTIGGAALGTLKADILKNQTTEIDGVAGATFTSDGVKAAVSAALAEARGEEVASGEEEVVKAEVAEGALFAPGTYEATEKGFGGEITVTVTVTDTEITDVTIVGDSETPGIGGAAVEEMGDRIVEAQTPNVDGNSGATISSTAIIKAATKALEAAGADVDALGK
jgi:fumarate reductase flavoprotein subunit